MSRTLEFYDGKADEMSSMYERVGDTGSLDRFVAAIPPGCRVLDVGCGSGRDAARLLALGFDVHAVDGSVGMRERALALHPELRGRISHVELPAVLPFDPASFDAAMAWAVIMHLNRDRLPAVFAEVARVVRPGGVFAYSVNTERSGRDADDRDVAGRRFTCLPSEAWERLHAAAGFRTEWAEQTDDITGRPGIRWVTFLTTRERSRAVGRDGPRRGAGPETQ
ncbi:MAG: class I SAM-dependent methyltransferase [Spirochaetaceae bacterium]|nr:MAG: class I SAM-dependent methyltransferase [Spirochaetaceae bacterium]